MREKKLFDFDWKFYKGDLAPKKADENWSLLNSGRNFYGAAAMDFDDSEWEDRKPAS